MDIAVNLLQEKGFNGFSYKDISSELDIKNAAVHYHFPSKSDLGEAILERERRRFQKWIQRKQIRDLDYWGKLDWYFSIYTQYMDNGNKVCIPGSIANQFFDTPESMRTQAEGLVADMSNWLTGVLGEGLEQGAFHYEGTPKNKAMAIMAAMSGSLQLTRIAGEAHLQPSIDHIKESLR